MGTRSQGDIKTKLLAAALYLFNRFGFVSVRLQHIADEAGVSVGNLAYHFNTKDALVEALYQSIQLAQEKLLSDLRHHPLFSSLDQYIRNTFSLQQQYSFFFTDTLELMRAFPSLKQAHRKHLDWQTRQVDWLLTFSSARGALRIPVAPDSSVLLAHRCMLLTESWVNFERMRGIGAHELTITNYRLAVWSVLSPYFTTKGMLEFKHLNSQ
ncbi:TetR/AcrR family transcriptional regulator [Spirosoma sp. KCTC 42546]|uniref:TetR/AcrR family transcriptional regulator n=1 Tax=Spirosoma sp. KCTC 42546 TaxID=2520506 RepID=UPI001159463C|nr:TetR/AcrR family transcriptional regulator [Spirosoma sp. KCTC 42546]QDK81020.1 TetR/AcrR family transcriptional regulator [Spirosoma sp. KCTC 42546]